MRYLLALVALGCTAYPEPAPTAPKAVTVAAPLLAVDALLGATRAQLIDRLGTPSVSTTGRLTRLEWTLDDSSRVVIEEQDARAVWMLVEFPAPWDKAAALERLGIQEPGRPPDLTYSDGGAVWQPWTNCHERLEIDPLRRIVVVSTEAY